VVGTVDIGVLQALQEVQKFDEEIDLLSAQSAKLPHEAQATAIAQKIAEGERAIAKLQATMKVIDERVTTLDDKAIAARAKAVDEMTKIDKGEIDYRQMEAVTQDISAHAQRVEVAETQGLELLTAREEAERRIESIKQGIAELEQAKARILADYRQELATLATRAAQIAAQRDAKRTEVDDELLARYDELRSERGGVVVATFDGERCDGCSIALPTAIAEEFDAPGSVGICSECRRLLMYLGEDPA